MKKEDIFNGIPDVCIKLSPFLNLVRFKEPSDFQNVMRNVLCDAGLIDEKYRRNDLNEELQESANEIFDNMVKRAIGWYNRGSVNRKRKEEAESKKISNTQSSDDDDDIKDNITMYKSNRVK